MNGGDADGPGAPDEPADRTLDVRGRTCPMPILLLTRAVRELSLGETLEVLADDAQFPDDVRAWCDYSGNRLVAFDTKGDYFVACVERAERPAAR